MAIFFSKEKVRNAECVGNVEYGFMNHGPCPPATPASTFSNETRYLEGPVPAGGGSVSNLEATSDTGPTGAGTYLIEIVDNTTGGTLLSCSITAASPTQSCENNGTTPVAAGHYLQVRMTKTGSPSPKDTALRITFRY